MVCLWPDLPPHVVGIFQQLDRLSIHINAEKSSDEFFSKGICILSQNSYIIASVSFPICMACSKFSLTSSTVGYGLVFQIGFPYIPDNAIQIIMKDMAVKIIFLYLTQFPCPHIQIIFSRCVFFKNGLPGSSQKQIHLVHSHISDLVNKDFHINHQPPKKSNESPVHKAGGC